MKYSYKVNYGKEEIEGAIIAENHAHAMTQVGKKLPRDIKMGFRVKIEPFNSEVFK